MISAAIEQYSPVSSTESSAGTVRRVPITLIDYSPTNPRTSFDERGLHELAASIKSMGLLQPVTVRPKAEGRYEVIAGERRTRAHVLAQLDTIDVIVRDMADSDVLTAQTIENLQRADLTPIEEADGFALLLSQDEPPITVAELATRIGKSVGYVRSRVQLTHLVDEAKTALRANTLSLRVALHIARLTEADQGDILPWATEMDDWNGHRPGERQVADEIERRYFLDLARTPFDTKDATLVEGKPACVACPLRTGFDPSLFPDIKKKDTCTDRACFNAKRDAHVTQVVQVQIGRAQRKDKATPPPIVLLSAGWETPRIEHFVDTGDDDSVVSFESFKQNEYVIVRRGENCEHTRPGVLVDGADAGKVQRICTDAACKTHRTFHVKSPDTEDYRAKERERMKKLQQERVVLRRVLDASIAAMPMEQGVTLGRLDLQFVATAMVKRFWYEHIKQMAKARGIEPAKPKYGSPDYIGAMCTYIEGLSETEVLRFLMDLSLSSDAWPTNYGTDKPEQLLALAKRVGVDVAAIRTEVHTAARAKAKGSKKKTRTSKKVVSKQGKGSPHTE